MGGVGGKVHTWRGLPHRICLVSEDQCNRGSWGASRVAVGMLSSDNVSLTYWAIFMLKRYLLLCIEHPSMLWMCLAISWVGIIGNPLCLVFDFAGGSEIVASRRRD